MPGGVGGGIARCSPIPISHPLPPFQCVPSVNDEHMHERQLPGAADETPKGQKWRGPADLATPRGSEDSPGGTNLGAFGERNGVLYIDPVPTVELQPALPPALSDFR